MKRVASILVLLAGFTCHSLAGPLEDGQRAFASGRYGEAIGIWTPEALSGNPEAQFRLGGVYRQGRGVARDTAMAVRWYRQAILSHHPGATLTLAEIYRDRSSGFYDPDAGLDLLRVLATQGSIEARRDLGVLYRKGDGAPQDFDEAAKWFRLAAAQGDIASLAGLGELYRYGYGVPQDLSRAQMWFMLAASAVTGNDPDRTSAARVAAEARDTLTRLMSQKERDEAETLAVSCWKRRLQNCD